MTIHDFNHRHRGQRCFLLGNGPSLADMDLSGLAQEVTFSCNRGYLLFPQLGFHTTYWAVEDTLDIEQFGAEFAALDGPVKFTPDDVSYPMGGVTVPFIRAPFDGLPIFSSTPPFYFGGTVMYLLLQLAAFMGCSIAYLLGNDFRWDVTRVSCQQGQWVTGARDDNHFDGTYWPVGARSFPPQADRMRRAFVAAHNYPGMRIINVTPNSALDVFEHEDFASVLAYV